MEVKSDKGLCVSVCVVSCNECRGVIFGVICESSTLHSSRYDSSSHAGLSCVVVDVSWKVTARHSLTLSFSHLADCSLTLPVATVMISQTMQKLSQQELSILQLSIHVFLEVSS